MRASEGLHARWPSRRLRTGGRGAASFPSQILSLPESAQLLAWLTEVRPAPAPADLPLADPELLHRASRDGFQGSDFHRQCDGKGERGSHHEGGLGATFWGRQ